MLDEDEWDVMDDGEDSSDEEGESPTASYQAAGDDLAKLGIAVLPGFDAIARRHWEKRMYDAMDTFPEYKRNGRGVQRVLGGFGALGNPSSFHHPDVRMFRRMRKKHIFRPLMGAYVTRKYGPKAATDVKLEALFDRLCVRCEDFNRPSAEAWHRDIYGSEKYHLRPLPHTLPGKEQDLLFGGWTNLDAREQAFVGLVGTHNDGVTGKGGFDKYTASEIQKYGFDRKLLAQANRQFGSTIRTNAEGHVRIPPGYCLVFQQQLIHSVLSGPQPDTPALRVFHGLRLTTESAPLFDITAAIENGGVPRIPSGQIPPMYSANHYQFFATHERYQKWAQNTFRAECLYKRTTKSGVVYFTPGSRENANRAANAGRYMPSLSEMGLWDERFAYSEREKRAMYPQRLVRV